ncbi:hypothetical protein [Devosia ginsengisoli]|uniref:Uncharacterized protein n=1 Tax=Devosia ginsengisoli TaxID=400770 RepID=A0A5B8LS76_9HYPH|nr:hypothetical protein [Devosia ginsengisoli]QDZ10504.1 hypothetical protein FPZ08_06925 [Devosia ginsengisoli]
MQVNVFISEVDGAMGGTPRLLILPAGPNATIPENLRSYEWTYFATTTTDDKLIGAATEIVEAGIARHGYALVSPTG